MLRRARELALVVEPRRSHHQDKVDRPYRQFPRDLDHRLPRHPQDSVMDIHREGMRTATLRKGSGQWIGTRQEGGEGEVGIEIHTNIGLGV